MAALPADHYGKEMVNSSPDADSDMSDVQQVEGKDYNPARDQRDMKRLGKRQELKVSPNVNIDINISPSKSMRRVKTLTS